MTPDDNEAIVRRFYEGVFNAGRADIVADVFAPRVQDAAAPEPIEPRAYADDVLLLREYVPDLHVTIEEMRVEGETVSARVRLVGTQQGSPHGHEPTYQRLDVTAYSERRIVDSQIVEQRGSLTVAGILDKVGVRTSGTAPQWGGAGASSEGWAGSSGGDTLASADMAGERGGKTTV